jgi:hypothetical protein
LFYEYLHSFQPIGAAIVKVGRRMVKRVKNCVTTMRATSLRAKVLASHLLTQTTAGANGHGAVKESRW